MSVWAGALGAGLTTAGGGVLGWEEEKRKRDQEAMIRALQSSQLDTEDLHRQIMQNQDTRAGSAEVRADSADARAQEDQKRQQQDFTNRTAQGLLMDLPSPQVASPEAADVIGKSVYSSQLTPNQLLTRSTIGGMSLPGGPDPVQSESTTLREAGPQNGQIMNPLVNPAIRVAQINADSRLAQLDNRLGYQYDNLNRLWSTGQQNADTRAKLADTQVSRLQEMIQSQNAQRALRDKIATMEEAGRQGNRQAQDYAKAYQLALSEIGKDPTAAFAPDYTQKVEGMAQTILKTMTAAAPPMAPVPSHGPAAPAAGPRKSPFTIVSVTPTGK